LASAVRGNTLVVLPTGLGKTLVAVLLGLIRGEQGKVLFLAPTKPLVEQHAKSIRELTGGRVEPVIMDGSIPRQKRQHLWETAGWLVATPQTVQNDLLRGQSLEKVSLVVFDEAHRAVGDYAYVYIARKYKEDTGEGNPLFHVLALTASPGKDGEKIREVLGHLFIKHVEVRTEEDPDVRPYVGEKLISWQEVQLPPAYRDFVNKVKGVLRLHLQALKKMGHLGSADLSRVHKRDLITLQQRTQDYDTMSAVAAALKAHHALEMVESQGMLAYAAYLEKLEGDRTRAAHELMKQLPKPDFSLDHPKMGVLIDLIGKETKGQIIVFSHFRQQGKNIVAALTARGVDAEVFVGQKEGMSQKKQKEVVERFRKGAFRVLVATSVAEEGMDIPSVKLIIFYEPVPSSIRHIQRKGRLRGGGKVKILATRGTREQAYIYSSRRKELGMVQTLRRMGGQSLGESHLIVPTPGQTRLDLAPEIKVVVDDREFDLAKRLGDGGGVNFKRLEIGDVVVSDKIVVERKTTADFVSSIVDGRLFRQATEMKDLYENPLIIIEGQPSELYTHRAIHPNAIRGALASLVLKHGVPIIFTRDLQDTADFIRVLVTRESKPDNGPSIKVPKAGTLREQQERLVCALPGINLVLARRLLDHFREPLALFTTDIKGLQEVEGIGKKKATLIFEVLRKA